MLDAPTDLREDIKPYLKRLLTIYYELKETKKSQSGLEELRTKIEQLCSRLGKQTVIDEIL